MNAGVGGAEACRFLEELSRGYSRFAEIQGWDIDIISKADGPVGKGGSGFREITMRIEPKKKGWSGEDDMNGEGGCYGLLKFESGVHRVQRVPISESAGRIQTSFVSVSVSFITAGKYHIVYLTGD
jgi:peptide chain release factor 1